MFHELFAFPWTGWSFTWPTQLLALIWIAWLVSWAMASLWSARTEKHVMIWDSRAYRVPIIAGALLLTPQTAQLLAEKPLWHLGNGGTYVLAGLTDGTVAQFGTDPPIHEQTPFRSIGFVGSQIYLLENQRQ